LSEIYYEEAVTDAVKKIEKGEFLQAA
jgi:hypothetical protein